MVKNKKYINMVKEKISEEDFSAPVSKKLLKMIFEAGENGKLPEPSVIITAFDGGDAQIAGRIFYNNEIYSDEEKSINDLIIDLKKSKINKEIKNTKDPVRLKELIAELTKLGRA